MPNIRAIGLGGTQELVSRTFAVEYIRRMRGGTQAQLLRCADGGYYVVKFLNNPQGMRVLANDLLGTLLAAQLGLPVPHPAIVDVSREIVRHSEEMVIQLKSAYVPCSPGLCFGSRYPCDESCAGGSGLAAACEFVSDAQTCATENVRDFAGMLVFDKWTCNTDDRQVIFCRQGNHRTYRALMIDEGQCFNGMHWTFPDAPLRGLYRSRAAYTGYRGFDVFEPWLGRLENEINEDVLQRAGSEIPTAWYERDTNALARLLRRLNHRRNQVRDLLWSLLKASPGSFPNWSDHSVAMRSRAASMG